MMRIMSSSSRLLMVLFSLTSLISTTLLGGGVVAKDFRCGKDFGGALCPDGHCCSKLGHCGNTSSNCHLESCQSQCNEVPSLRSTTEASRQLEPNQRCGKKFGGAFCKDGSCCSYAGWCGITEGHCKTSCQTQCYDPSKCGFQGPTKCGPGFCCSIWGYCGKGDAWCAPGNCQSQCPKATFNEVPSLSSTTEASLQLERNLRCGKKFGGARCVDGSCCSQSGYCGKTDAHCKSGCQSQCYDPSKCGFQGPTKCGPGFCCSKWGYCGAGDAWCAPGNCQSQCPKGTFNGGDHDGILIELPLGAA